jgi:hypothetical protein
MAQLPQAGSARVRARATALFLSLALIIGAIMSPAWGCNIGQTLGQIIWVTIDAESFLASLSNVITSKNVLKFSLLARIADQDVGESGDSECGQRRYESIVGICPSDEQRRRLDKKSPKLFGAIYVIGGYIFLIWGGGAVFLRTWRRMLGLIIVLLGVICLAHGFEALTH